MDSVRGMSQIASSVQTRERVAVEVADHVAARIAAGELAPGAMLPSERDMAAEYGVAIGTVRRAVDELRARGLVVTLASKGSYIAAPRA